MGLLAVLHSHKKAQSGQAEEGVEIEYRLHSWGEIYPPFLGDREHSVAARFILREFPFKLFSSSIPYDDPLPQKLCLTFRALHEIKKETEHVHVSGIFAHEIAKEFAAFLSLVTRRRVFTGIQMRYDRLPIEQKGDIYEKSHFQERQTLKEIDPKEIYRLLDNLEGLEDSVANGFILTMRLYHSAVEMMYTEPEFSYLFLVTALETISSVIYKDYRPENEEDFLNSRFPGWREALGELSNEQTRVLKKMLLKNESYTFQKLLKFVSDNLPEKFWSETKDDAKPDYLTGVIWPGPNGKAEEKFTHSDKTLQDFEKIGKEGLRGALRAIYAARSKLVHEGIRFPASITLGHFRRLPSEVLAEMSPLMSNQAKMELKVLPLLTFERLVSYSVVEFLRRQHI